MDELHSCFLCPGLLKDLSNQINPSAQSHLFVFLPPSGLVSLFWMLSQLRLHLQELGDLEMTAGIAGGASSLMMVDSFMWCLRKALLPC